MLLAGDYSVIPRFDRRRIALAENSVAFHVEGALSELQSYTSDLESAVELFRFARQQLDVRPRTKVESGSFGAKDDAETLIRRWQFIAADSAAMSVWHFGECLKGIKSSIRLDAPALNSKVNWEIMREATNLYKSHFPHSEGLRHAVAHRANLTETRKAAKENAVKKPLNQFGINSAHGAMLKSNLRDNTLFYSIGGEIRSLDVTRQSVTKLVAVRDKFYMAFDAVKDRRFEEVMKMAEAYQSGPTPDRV